MGLTSTTADITGPKAIKFGDALQNNSLCDCEQTDTTSSEPVVHL